MLLQLIYTICTLYALHITLTCLLILCTVWGVEYSTSTDPFFISYRVEREHTVPSHSCRNAGLSDSMTTAIVLRSSASRSILFDTGGMCSIVH
jgi:hypothetical protein